MVASLALALPQHASLAENVLRGARQFADTIQQVQGLWPYILLHRTTQSEDSAVTQAPTYLFLRSLNTRR